MSGQVCTLAMFFTHIVNPIWWKRQVRNVGKSSGGIHSSCRTSSHIVESPHPKLLLGSSSAAGNNLESHRTSSPDLLALSGSQHYYNHKVFIFIFIIVVVIGFNFAVFQLAVWALDKKLKERESNNSIRRNLQQQTSSMDGCSTVLLHINWMGLVLKKIKAQDYWVNTQ